MDSMSGYHAANDASNNQEESLSRQMDNLIKIGVALSSEKDHRRLMEMIITEARRITNSDGGTLYLVDGDFLRIEILHNSSMNVFKGGTSGESVDLPPVPLQPSYASAYVAMHEKTMRFDDVYQAADFDFSGARKYDEITGYRTTSMLVIPLKDHLNEVIGVMQLINAMDPENNTVVPFDTRSLAVVEALASLAAIALTNMNLIQEVENLFAAFTRVIVTAIDEQTPYNVSHTRQVVSLAQALAQKINEIDDGPYAEEHFDTDRLEALSMAGWLHDIGKIATPLQIMNKATRLDSQLPLVLQRIDYAREREMRNSLQEQVKLLKTGCHQTAWQVEEESQSKLNRLQKARELVLHADNPDNFVDDDLRRQLSEIANLQYYDSHDNLCHLLSEEELRCLSVGRGTLTEEERNIIQEHVDITERMLNEVPFSRKLAKVPTFACMHHEYLDGSGYPRGVSAEEIPLEARILAVVDIFTALTASDRPYRDKIPEEKAASIVSAMAEEGKLDPHLVKILVQNKLWEAI